MSSPVLPLSSEPGVPGCVEGLDPTRRKRRGTDDQLHRHPGRHRPGRQGHRQSPRDAGTRHRMRGVDRRDPYVRGQRGAQQDNVADICAAFTALCQAVRIRSNIWLPFPLDLIREEHARRLSLVLQRHGLELLIGRAMWSRLRTQRHQRGGQRAAPEVRAVDDPRSSRPPLAGLDAHRRNRVDAEGGSCAFSDGELRRAAGRSAAVGNPARPHRVATTERRAVRRSGLSASPAGLFIRCEMTQAQAATFLNALGQRTKSGRSWQRSTVAALVSRRVKRQSAA